MKKLFVFIVIILAQQSDLFGQNPYFHYLTSSGGTGNAKAFGVRANPDGSSLLTGSFDGICDLGNTSFTPNGQTDAFVAKVNVDGTFAWARAIGGPGNDYGRNAISDRTGNSYFLGSFTDSMAVGPTLLKSKGGEDLFLMKVDLVGNVIWVQSFGGPGQNVGIGLTLDSLGNPIICGYFNSSMSIGDSTWTGTGGFLAKVHSQGNLLWAKGMKFQTCTSVHADISGNIFLGGSFDNSLTLGPSTIVSKGGLDGFLAKLDTGGNFLWAKSFGGSTWDQVLAVSSDYAGNVYSTGHFESTVTLGDSTVTSIGQQDIIVSKWSASGENIWNRFYGSPGLEQGNGISTDSIGNCYVTGVFSGPMVINSQLYQNQPANALAPWILKLSQNGAFQWFHPLLTTFGVGRDISVDTYGNGYATGYYNNSLQLGASYISANGGSDVFLLKFGNSPVGISPKNEKSLLQLFPNPAKDIVQISAPFPLQTVIISDLLGRVFPLSLDNENQLDVSGLPSGCYLLKVNSHGASFQEKLLIE